MAQTIQILPSSELDKILLEINYPLYYSAMHDLVLLDIQFRGVGDGYGVGEEIARKTGTDLYRSEFNKQEGSGVWTFYLGENEELEHPQRVKVLREIYARGISTNRMTVYVPSFAREELRRLREKVAKYLQNEISRIVASIPTKFARSELI